MTKETLQQRIEQRKQEGSELAKKILHCIFEGEGEERETMLEVSYKDLTIHYQGERKWYHQTGWGNEEYFVTALRVLAQGREVLAGTGSNYLSPKDITCYVRGEWERQARGFLKTAKQRRTNYAERVKAEKMLQDEREKQETKEKWGL